MKNVACGTLSMCVLVNISQMGEIRFRFDSPNQMISPSVHDWQNKCHNIITTQLPLTYFDWSLCSCGLQSYEEKMWGPRVLFCCWGFKSAINRFKSSLKSEFGPEGKACCGIRHFMHPKLFAAPSLFRNGSRFLWFSFKTYITPQHTNYKQWQNEEVPCLHRVFWLCVTSLQILSSGHKPFMSLLIRFTRLWPQITMSSTCKWICKNDWTLSNSPVVPPLKA